jgi:D-alanyl-lipoteichoic acid acyltransferase DltB (MBOAT superfamily)
MPRIVTTLLSHPFFAIGLPHGSEWLYILIFGVGGTILWVAALINCITKESETGNTKIVWVLVIILLGFFGALAYFFIRRPLRIKELGR